METLGADVVCRSTSPPALTTPSENDGPGPGPVVCGLCLSAPGKYTCPRCNAPYCSLACYKGARHCACSELFYRESVLQALQDQEGGGKRQVEEVLLRLRRQEEEELLEGVTDEEEVGLWGSLSHQEKEHFNRLLVSGHVGSLVPQWTPWWDLASRGKVTELPLPTCGHDSGTNPQSDTPLTDCSPKQTNRDVAAVPDQVASPPEKTDDAQMLVPHTVNERKDSLNTTFVKDGQSDKHGHHKTTSQDVSVEDTPQGDPRVDDKSVPSQVPQLLHTIPPLRQLTRNPSPLVRFTLVNVIYGYSFSLIRHNGDLSDDDDVLDFVGTLLSVSGALSTATVYNATAHAMKSAVRAATDPLLGGDEGVAVLAMEATAKILLGDGGKRYSLAALSHLYRLLGKIRKVVMEEKDVRKGAYNAKKKCLFLAAWVNENGDRLAVLSAEVMMEYKQYLNDLNEIGEISQGLQRVWGGKRPPAKNKLIEEVN